MGESPDQREHPHCSSGAPRPSGGILIELDALLKPRSVAVLGASERPSAGRTVVQNLERIGFNGEIFPINPRYETLLGRRCYRSVEELPDGVDVLAFCVNHERVLDGLRSAAKKGVRAAVAFDAGFAESDDTGRRRQDELVAICREAGIAFCGPNCMGAISPHERSLVYLNELRDPAPLAGNVGLISQSGSIVIGLLADCRRFGWSRVVSTGNEAVIVAADVLEYLVDDPATRVIAMFLESVRQPERFVAALDRAADRGKPVVVLKVGRSERARRAITSHTGGLAGESRVIEAVLRAHRAIEVHDMDELTETLAAFQGGRRPAGRRIAVVTNSGGHTELILDLATSVGLELPALSPATRAEAARVIGPITGDGNPLDAWGNGDFRTNVSHALRTLGADPEIDAVVWCTDSADASPLGSPERFMTYAGMLVEGAQESTKPFYLMGTRPGIFRRDQHELLSAQGIALIGGTRQGLRAIDRLALQAAPPAPLRPPPATTMPALATMMPGGTARRTIHEHDAKRLLAGAGLPVVRETLCTTREEALAAARAIGYPVALKLVADDVPHRSDLGLVAVGLRDPRELGEAWDRMTAVRSRKLGDVAVAGFVVQQMVSGGVEVLAGVHHDRDFGPVLAFGLGGVAAEALARVALRPLPLRVGDAEAMVAEVPAAATLLAGFRGHPPADLDGLHRCLEALGDYAWADRAAIAELDLNPITVLPRGRGCVVVDALIVPRGRRAEEPP
ncbi:MAG TPA: acetate--CoA ligase family protein [Candidatus Limnocylindria bacterium]|nr:acetate--CoA ligase family protein [Candidatus Limnocylindria bacterium]